MNMDLKAFRDELVGCRQRLTETKEKTTKGEPWKLRSGEDKAALLVDLEVVFTVTSLVESEEFKDILLETNASPHDPQVSSLVMKLNTAASHVSVVIENSNVATIPALKDDVKSIWSCLKYQGDVWSKTLATTIANNAKDLRETEQAKAKAEEALAKVSKPVSSETAMMPPPFDVKEILSAAPPLVKREGTTHFALPPQHKALRAKMVMREARSQLHE